MGGFFIVTISNYLFQNVPKIAYICRYFVTNFTYGSHYKQTDNFRYSE